MNSYLYLSLAACVFLPLELSAEPLQQAIVNKIVRDVKVIDFSENAAHPAVLREVVSRDEGVRTGIESRAELLFQDNTLTRLGAETLFTFQAGTREMSLQRGTILLQVPKGQGGARIRAGSVSASVSGTTVLMEYRPGRILKVLVLEGRLRVSLPKRLGEALTLEPGQVLIMDPNANSLPDPITIDIDILTKSSLLVSAPGVRLDAAPFAPVPSIQIIEKETTKQKQQQQQQGGATQPMLAARVDLAANGPVGATLVSQGTSSPVTVSDTLVTTQDRNTLVSSGGNRGKSATAPGRIGGAGKSEDAPGQNKDKEKDKDKDREKATSAIGPQDKDKDKDKDKGNNGNGKGNQK